LGWEPKTLFFDHALEKSLYPEYKYIKENIIMVTWKEHSEKGSAVEHPNYSQKIKEIREKL